MGTVGKADLSNMIACLKARFLLDLYFCPLSSLCFWFLVPMERSVTISLHLAVSAHHGRYGNAPLEGLFNKNPPEEEETTLLAGSPIHLGYKQSLDQVAQNVHGTDEGRVVLERLVQRRAGNTTFLW